MRTVVVSGGGTGIGRAVAQAFAERGEQVVVIGRRAAVLDGAVAAIGRAAPGAPRVVAVTGDLTRLHDVERVAGEIGERSPTVDVLVHCAGGAIDNRPGWSPEGEGLAATAERWLADWRLNVLSTVLLTDALDDSLASPGGRVVLLSSIAAYRGSGSYGSAKAALHPLAYHLARELGPRGITANVVAPGYTVETEFFGEQMTSARHRMLVDQTATGRPGTPADVAAAIVWLASPDACHVTGQIVQINGGAELGR
jgi:3-oxoacyl-[acyl-carrier protein] reductase